MQHKPDDDDSCQSNKPVFAALSYGTLNLFISFLHFHIDGVPNDVYLFLGCTQRGFRYYSEAKFV